MEAAKPAAGPQPGQRRVTPAPLRCSRCPARLTSSDTLRKHEMTHDGAKPVYCDLCEARFVSLSSLTYHRNAHTGRRPFRCDRCDKAYADPSVLRLHRLALHEGRRLKCKKCKRTYRTASSLRYHELVSHAPAERWPCPRCDKVFALELNMNRHLEKMHIKVELSEMPGCPICSKTFKCQRYLTRHVKRHGGERPHQCQTCGRRFTESGHLRSHQLTHGAYESRPHQCAVCQKRFCQSSTRKRHMRIHTGEKPFTCTRCLAAFSDKTSLVVHAKSEKCVQRSPGEAG